MPSSETEMEVEEVQGPRVKQINFKVTEEEAYCFEKVAEFHGIPVAAMIRMLVKREHRKEFCLGGERRNP